MESSIKESILVYLDQNNLYFRYKKMNFKKLYESIADRFNVIRATAYTAIDRNNDQQKKFLTYMSSNGWRVNVLDLSIGSNVDNMINVDASNEVTSFKPNVICIIACDGDYEYLLDNIRRQGIKVLVIGANENISLELRMVADEIIYLESIDGVIL